MRGQPEATEALVVSEPKSCRVRSGRVLEGGMLEYLGIMQTKFCMMFMAPNVLVHYKLSGPVLHIMLCCTYAL